MINFQDTAYPRFKKSYSDNEFIRLFLPDEEEILLCRNNTTGEKPFICMLLIIKCFQNLGRFTQLSDIPKEVVSYICGKFGYNFTIEELSFGYQDSGTKRRHVKCVRDYLKIKPFNEGGQELLKKVILETALVKNELIDLINISLDYLIKDSYEIPAFRTIHDLCKHYRAEVNHKIYNDIYENLKEEGRLYLDNLFSTREENNSLWNTLKTDFEKPGFKVMHEMLTRKALLESMSRFNKLIEHLPPIKIQTFYEEINGYDIGSVYKVKETKRLTLIICFLYTKLSKINDDLCLIFIKRMKKFHQQSKIELQKYLDKNAEKTEAVFRTFNHIEDNVKSDHDKDKKINDITNIVHDNQNLFDYARTQVELGIKNHNRFMWKFFKKSRKRIFKIISSLELYSTSSDNSIINAIEFAIFNFGTSTEWLYPGKIYKRKGKTGPILVDVSWVPEGWWKLLTGKNTRNSFPQKINRKQFEVCLCNQIMLELLSGDLCIQNSIEYADYRKELISDAESLATLNEYEKIVGIPVDKKSFILHIQQNLENAASVTDETYPENTDFNILNGEPKLKKYIPSEKDKDKSRKFESLLDKKMQKFGMSLLDILISSNNLLNLTKFFGPNSGHEGKIKDEEMRYILTIFAYGTGLGPTQTTKAVPEVNRRKISFLNLRHTSIDKIENCIRDVVNAYNKFDLPKLWGDGSRAAADGTYWDMYENNLLSEYHIRYGQFGGIAYYHVSDTYIAIFSHFISCGVREGVYILDGLSKNKSDIQPDTIHGDTHAQMLTGFGLSLLLGIKLMPRIKNWKDLNFYKANPEKLYEHIESLFQKEKIDWDLIETHLYDMIRVAQSIKAGKINPSTILKRLTSGSRKNKLYFAFRELGRVVRTTYLLNYLSDQELRRIVQSCTNKCEAFNKFVKWIYFGEDLITKNDREEQIRVIKYSHLIAAVLTFYNVYAMTKSFKELTAEGHEVDPALVSRISPYRTAHVNRFGTYEIQPRALDDIDYELKLDV